MHIHVVNKFIATADWLVEEGGGGTFKNAAMERC